MSTAEELLCNRVWRLRNGAWMLWGLVSFGLLWGVGFAIIGVRARNRTWLILSGIWVAFLIAYIAVVGVTDTPGKGEPSTPISSALGGALMVSFITGGALAWFVNRKWLIWLARNGRRRPWYSAAVSTIGPISTESESPEAAVDRALRMPEPAHIPAMPPVVAPAEPLVTSPAPAAAYAPGTVTTPAPAQIDLNEATRDQLASLPGIDQAWAEHIINMRARVGGFRASADLVTVANVQPHVFAGIRDRIFVNLTRTQKSAPAADGRRLEF